MSFKDKPDSIGWWWLDPANSPGWGLSLVGQFSLGKVEFRKGRWSKAVPPPQDLENGFTKAPNTHGDWWHRASKSDRWVRVHVRVTDMDDKNWVWKGDWVKIPLPKEENVPKESKYAIVEVWREGYSMPTQHVCEPWEADEVFETMLSKVRTDPKFRETTEVRLVQVTRKALVKIVCEEL